VARHHGGKRSSSKYRSGCPAAIIRGRRFFLRAEVARQAFFSTPGEVSGVVHPGGNGLLVRPVARRVRAKPRGSGSMAALAADAFAQIKSFGARIGRDVKRVAGETFRRQLGFAEARISPCARPPAL